jgi:hypothetical protein
VSSNILSREPSLLPLLVSVMVSRAWTTPAAPHASTPTHPRSLKASPNSPDSAPSSSMDADMNAASTPALRQTFSASARSPICRIFTSEYLMCLSSPETDSSHSAALFATLDMGTRMSRRSQTIPASQLVSVSRLIADVSIALSNSCANQGQTATPTGADPVPTPSGTIPYTGGGISLASFSSGSYSTHAANGTTSHASAYTTAMTGGTNTGTATTTGTTLIATPSSLTGGSLKIKNSIEFGGLMCLITFVSMLMAFGELV